MKILLAIDDSKYSEEAIRALLKQFGNQDNEVRVLNVVEPIRAYVSADAFPHFVPQIEGVEEDRHKQAKAFVKRVAERLAEAGLKTNEVVDLGDPKTIIIENAAAWGADLIMVGSHGWAGLNRFLLGSVSEAVARHALCSVEIVRIGSSADGAKKQKGKR